MSRNPKIKTLFRTNSTKNVMKSHSYDIIPYKFNQKMSWNLKIIILFHSNSSKNVMDSQNHDIILYKIYQKCHDISKTWHYSIQILPKHHKISQSWHYTIQILQKHHEMSWSHTNMKLFHTNSTKNVIKSLNHGYYMQILPKASWNLEIMILFLQILQNKLYEI